MCKHAFELLESCIVIGEFSSMSGEYGVVFGESSLHSLHRLHQIFALSHNQLRPAYAPKVARLTLRVILTRKSLSYNLLPAIAPPLLSGQNFR